MLTEQWQTSLLSMYQNRMKRTEVSLAIFPPVEETLAQLHPFPGRVGNGLEVLKKEASDLIVMNKLQW